MMKKILATSLIGMMLLFSGCGESDAVDPLETQQMLDDKDYIGVINKLENRPASDMNNIALGDAYMGKSGLGLLDVVQIMLADNNDTGASDDAFSVLAEGIDEKKSSTALSDLKLSTYYYEEVVNCDDENLTSSQNNICLRNGMAQTVRAIVAISYLGDIASIAASAADSTSDELDASTCAMQYANDMNDSSLDPTVCTAFEDGNVTFDNNATYTQLEITMPATGNKYDYLITKPTAGIRQTALTEGYCTSSDFTRYDINTTDRNAMTKVPVYPLLYTVDPLVEVHACPVNEGAPEDEVTAADILVNVLNGGLDAIVAATGGDTELATEVEGFKYEILGINEADVTEDTNTTITIDDITAYLNSQP